MWMLWRLRLSTRPRQYLSIGAGLALEALLADELCRAPAAGLSLERQGVLEGSYFTANTRGF
jgi:hypothetical protein